MTDAVDEADLIRVVLADANVLYSRVLRDYLLYAADQEIIAVAWSSEILAEVTEHLVENVAGFDMAAGERLVRAMNHAFPLAEVEPGEEHFRMLAHVPLPNEGDRHDSGRRVSDGGRERLGQKSGHVYRPRGRSTGERAEAG